MLKVLNPNKLKLISKGVDSVKSRVLNLKEMNPNLNKDLIFDSISSKFKAINNLQHKEIEFKEIEDENNIENDIIRNIYNETNSWNWKFGECPEFTNSLQHKFDWGLVDLSIKAEKGMIIEKRIYSDCLNSEFIDYLNEELNNLTEVFKYDKDGFVNLFKVIKQTNIINSNPEYIQYVEEMESTLINYI